MDPFTFGVVFVGVPLFLIIFVVALVRGRPEQNLRKKFVALGNMRGKTKEEIVALVGPPNSISAQVQGKSLLQWMQTSSTGAYHIGLLFDATGKVEKVTHEHANSR